jgi:hypothetical protein
MSPPLLAAGLAYEPGWRSREGVDNPDLVRIGMQNNAMIIGEVSHRSTDFLPRNAEAFGQHLH